MSFRYNNQAEGFEKRAKESKQKQLFGDSKRVNEASTILKSAQLLSLSLNHPTSAHFQEERLGQEKLSLLRRIEESYFKQRSHVNWLQTGDQNTTYFQKVAKARLAYNTIHTLEGLEGTVVSYAVAIGNLAIGHFRGILGPFMISPRSQTLLSVIIGLTRFTCSPLEEIVLLKSPSPDEITSTIFKLNLNKSFGADGLTSGFYKVAWSCIGEDVLVTINSFFHKPSMPLATNSTILTLIPKLPCATLIKNYRPISCCNTLYKLISKLLVARLKPLLPKLILPNQNSFIKGRLLLENSLVASEIVNGFHKNKGQKRVTLKIDIAKVFDSIR